MSEDKSQTREAPTVEQMEGAKKALINFLMYYYQALVHKGHSASEAKQIIAQEIVELYDQYAEISKITFRPNIIVNPRDVFKDILKDAKGMGIQGQGIYRKLVDFQRLWDSQ